ncbi:MAG: hypothetical protein ACKPCM_08065 [Pseudanabaena sp.]
MTNEWKYLHKVSYRGSDIAIYQVDHWFGARVVFQGYAYETEADLEEYVLERCEKKIDQSFPQPALEIYEDIPF